MMKRFGLLLILLAILAPLAGEIAAQTVENPVVRGVQLVADAPPADIYLDDITPATFQNVSYLSASRILSLSPGSHNLKVAPAGTTKEAAIISQDFTFNADTGYVLLATGRVATFDLQPILLRRALAQLPAPGMVLVRVFHGSPAASALRVSVVDLANGNTEFGAVSFRESTPFRTIPAGASTVYVRDGTGDTVYRATGTLATGGVITLILTGDPDGEDFRINVLAERNESAVSPLPALAEIVDTELGDIRFVNVYSRSTGGIDVEIGANDPVRFTNMAFVSASEVRRMPAGDYELTITPSGGSTPIYTGTITVIGGLYRAAYVIGNEDNASDDVIVLTADATSRPTAGRSAVRFLNAYSDTSFFPIWLQYEDGNRHLPLSSFGSFTPYDKVQPGEVSLRFSESTEDRPIYTSSVRADSIYTIVLAPERDGVNPHAAWLVSDDFRGAIPQLIRFDALSSVSTGSSDLAGHLYLFPSPASEYVEFSFDPELVGPGGISIRIVDARGQTVVEHVIVPERSTGGRRIVDCSGFASGNYHVLIHSADGSELLGTSRFTVLH